MPDPRDGKCGKMPHYCPGGMGTAGVDWCIIGSTGGRRRMNSCMGKIYVFLNIHHDRDRPVLISSEGRNRMAIATRQITIFTWLGDQWSTFEVSFYK